MIRKPKIIKEMAAPQAKTEVKNLFDYMKDTISIQKYVTLKNPFPLMSFCSFVNHAARTRARVI